MISTNGVLGYRLDTQKSVLTVNDNSAQAPNDSLKRAHCGAAALLAYRPGFLARTSTSRRIRLRN